jgi:hypothetical protein
MGCGSSKTVEYTFEKKTKSIPIKDAKNLKRWA